jgi:hypothetical protein
MTLESNAGKKVKIPYWQRGPLAPADLPTPKTRAIGLKGFF